MVRTAKKNVSHMCHLTPHELSYHVFYFHRINSPLSKQILLTAICELFKLFHACQIKNILAKSSSQIKTENVGDKIQSAKKSCLTKFKDASGCVDEISRS